MNTLLVSFLVATVALSAVNAVPAKKSQSNETTTEEPSSIETTSTLDVAEATVDLLTAFRKVMPCGYSALEIPVLAPFRVQNIPVSIEEELLTVNGTIKNLVVAGANDFIIINMATNSSTNRTTFDILFKGFQTLGDFDISVNADLAGYTFIQTLKGRLDIQVLNTRINGGMTIGEDKVGGMVFSDVDYFVQVGGIVSDTLDTEWSVAVNNYVNRYLSESAMLFLQTNREFVNEMLSGYVTPIMNKAMYNVSSSEFIESLVEATELYNSIECSA